MLGLHIMYYWTQVVAFAGATLTEGMISGVQWLNIDTTCSGEVHHVSRPSLPYLMVV